MAAAAFVLFLSAHGLTLLSQPVGSAPGRKASERVSDRVDMQAYLRAVAAHVPGKADEHLTFAAGLNSPQILAAVKDLAALRKAWTTAVVQRATGDERRTLKVKSWQGTVEEATALMRLTADEASRGDATSFVERAVLLHTDVLALRLEETSTPDVWLQHDGGTYHLTAARALVDMLRRDRHDPRFVHDWYLAVAATLHASHEVLTQPVFIDQARSVLPDQAELLVMAGTLHELLATPMPDAAGMPATLQKLSSGDHLRQAQILFREALRKQPGLAEARVRLARVLGELGRRAEALKELERLGPSQGDVRLAYLACLFRAQQEQALGDAEAAGVAYRDALNVVPGARSALLGLSYLARITGHRAAAVERVRSALERPEARRYDPWRDYFTAAAGRRAGALLAELRARISRGGRL